MSRSTAIYQLVDPRDDSVFYIGRTKHPELRLKTHMSPTKKSAETNLYIQRMLAEGGVPELVVLAWVNEEDARRCEKWKIQRCLDEGIYLTNSYHAGKTRDLILEYRDKWQEFREAISAQT